MQTQTERLTFWKKLVTWVEAMEATSLDYQQDQITRLRVDVANLDRRLEAMKNTPRQENRRVQGEQHV